MPWIPQGNDNLAYWCALLREPVVAIAGMDFERAAQAVQCGASSVAVISGITAADSPEQAMRGFADSIARAGRCRGCRHPIAAPDAGAHGRARSVLDTRPERNLP